jgi:hypothetical protein
MHGLLHDDDAGTAVAITRRLAGSGVSSEMRGTKDHGTHVALSASSQLDNTNFLGSDGQIGNGGEEERLAMGGGKLFIAARDWCVDGCVELRAPSGARESTSSTQTSLRPLPACTGVVLRLLDFTSADVVCM